MKGETRHMLDKNINLKLLDLLDTKSVEKDFDKIKRILTADPVIMKFAIDTSMTKKEIKEMASSLYGALSMAFEQNLIKTVSITVKDIETILSSEAASLSSAAINAQKQLNSMNKKSGGNLSKTKAYKNAQTVVQGLGSSYEIEQLNAAMKTLEDTYNRIMNHPVDGNKLRNPFIRAADEAEQFKSTIDELYLSYEQLTVKSEHLAKSMKVLLSQQDAFNNLAPGTDEWSQAFDNLKTSASSFMQELAVAKGQEPSGDPMSFDKNPLPDNTKQYASDMADIQHQLMLYGNTHDEIYTQAKASVLALSSAYEEMLKIWSDTEGNYTYNDKINSEQKYQQELTKTSRLLSQLKDSNDTEIVHIGDEKRVYLIDKLNQYLKENSKMNSENKKTIQEWVRVLASSDDMTVGAIQNINSEFESLDDKMRNTGQMGLSLGDKFKNVFEKLGSWGLVSSGLSAFYDQLKKMPEEVYKIDSAMTNLYLVTDETSIRYQNFLSSAGKSAQQLGLSIAELVQQTANWAKLGYNLDDSSKLAKSSSIYSNLNGTDDATAITDLETAMKAFNIAASDSIEIVDIYTKLGKEFSASANQIAEGVKNSSSTFALQGNTLEQTAALLSGSGDIGQNAGELGSALKVASLRLASMKDRLREIGQEYENIGSVRNNQDQISSLTKGQVSILDEQNGKLKNTYTILEDLSKVWNSIATKDQGTLLDLIFGKQGAEQGLAILSGFQSGQIQKAYDAAANASGTAYEQQGQRMESLESKTKQLGAAFQALSSTVVDSDFLKSLADSGTAVINKLDSILEKGNLLSTLGGAAGIFMSLKGLG